MAQARRTYAVNTPFGLNVREKPSTDAPILRVLPDGQKITADNAAKPPKGWKALEDGGFVMFQFLK